MKYILLLMTFLSLSFASIGKITAINGEAYAIRGASKMLLKEGSGIENKDIIKTMPNTKLQIVFNDHTVISLGQKTEFKIDDYIYSKKDVKANFSVAKGIFKSITGRIGKIDHSKFKLKTKNATIGVRGTTFVGIVEDDKETIACTSGEIVVQNSQGMVAVKKGEMTTYRAFEAPKPAKRYDNSFFKKVKSIKPEINSENITIRESREIFQKFTPIYNITNQVKTVQENPTTTTQESMPVFTGDNTVNSETSSESKSSTDVLSSATNTATSYIESMLPDTSSQSSSTSTVKDVAQEATQTVSNMMDSFLPVGDSDHSSATQDSSQDSFTQNFTQIFSTDDQQDQTTHSETTDDSHHSSLPSFSFNMTDDYGDFSNDKMTEVQDEVAQPENEQTSSETSSVDYQADLDALKEKVGGVESLHYEGKVSGEDIIDDGNRVSLDVDLGHGKISGNIKFTQEYGMFFKHNRDWDTDVQGEFQGGSRFSLNAASDGYRSENGYAELKGEHLEKAEGAMRLYKDSNSVDIQISADKSNISSN